MESSGSELTKPELIHKLEGSTDEIHDAVLIPGWYTVPVPGYGTNLPVLTTGTDKGAQFFKTRNKH